MFNYVRTFTGFPLIKSKRHVAQIPNYEDELISTKKIYGCGYTIEYTFNSNAHEWLTIYLSSIENIDIMLFPDVMKVKIDVVIDNYCKSFELTMGVIKYPGINTIELQGLSPIMAGIASIINSIEYNLLDFKSIKFELYKYEEK